MALFKPTPAEYYRLKRNWDLIAGLGNALHDGISEFVNNPINWIIEIPRKVWRNKGKFALGTALISLAACGSGEEADTNGVPQPENGTPTALPESAESTPIPAGSCSIHTVVSGDTAFSIAQKYRITLDELMSANGLVYERDGTTVIIHPGKIFNIPCRDDVDPDSTLVTGVPAQVTATPEATATLTPTIDVKQEFPAIFDFLDGLDPNIDYPAGINFPHLKHLYDQYYSDQELTEELVILIANGVLDDYRYPGGYFTMESDGPPPTPNTAATIAAQDATPTATRTP
ncbi:LysM peptidoglycan-binding domain-containing protein [Candidatus Dojkabacteria bacterium]|uniref:LysM peptidoglycan-binding domain-containing protein n=1 Tax=Candidatus Dojkabacteria bacterium TaxID=2099670 RepID=A0A955RL63_9BACT|nr:LysM peptidoglycan-binding domain-containing protein [Candidatus Dojkabacteria bacterium]